MAAWPVRLQLGEHCFPRSQGECGGALPPGISLAAKSTGEVKTFVSALIMSALCQKRT